MHIRKIKSFEYNLVRLGIIVNIWFIALKLYKNPFKATRNVRKMVRNFTKMIGKKKLVRAYKVNGKYAWDLFNPAWPSPGFTAFFKRHLIEIEPLSNDHSNLRRLLIAITKRCPLQCEHCSEAATLYQKDKLSFEDFSERIDKFVNEGVGQLVYSGGEPLSRFDDLLLFLERYNKACDQWIYTSGFGLTKEKAIQLKKAGLNGAAISLDHHIEEKHNAFRGNNQSYFWVMESIRNLLEVGILVAVNVCPTREYVEEKGLEELIELAKKMNIPLVNILEPRAVGNYQDKDVEFADFHFDYVSNLSAQFNFDKTKFDYPTVLFPAAFRKSMPCGGGRSYLLLDYDGTLYPCPFCKVKMPEVRSPKALCEAVS
jgi:MoaA/NifB/PqqE/SkfB family radical SAM enzyme